MDTIKNNVEKVRERIRNVLDRCDRSNDQLTVVGITKTWGADMVESLLDAGITHVGENRVQEFLVKHDQVKRQCHWHLVGHLQRNKAGKVIGRADCIQSLDSVRLAATLDRLSAEMGTSTNVYMQVNTSSEENKYGFAEEEAVERAEEIAAYTHLNLEGLMTIGPVSMDPDETRGCFRRLRRLKERVNQETSLNLTQLSMGMTGDFETAIEEGATVIRLGRILTGERLR